MQYRKFGKSNVDVSVLGFGCMRLPVLDEDSGKINEPEAIKIIRYAIDSGVNYIDTAYVYHKGTSEELVGKALKDGYREKVLLATKLPAWLVKTYDDFEKYLDEQLKKLDTDHVDCYLLHSLSKKTWENIRNLDVLKFVDEMIKKGKIKYIGFSFHDDYSVFKDIIDAYDWDFCQIQYNYMDENYQAGTKGLKYAASKGISVVVMEPLRGGRLVKNPPEEIMNLWNSSAIKRSPAEWGLRWVWNHPEVKVVLSGMGNMSQVVENINTACSAYPNSLTQDELDLIKKVREKYEALSRINCTGCKYCLPCPAGVAIPNNFEIYNDAFMYNTHEHSSFAYNNFLSENERASACRECGKCEAVCPQHLPIRQYLKSIHEAFGKNA